MKTYIGHFLIFLGAGCLGGVARGLLGLTFFEGLIVVAALLSFAEGIVLAAAPKEERGKLESDQNKLWKPENIS
jgi:hypothetical protein